MFDDPKKELQRLQQRLLEAEEPEWEPEDEDPESALRDMKEMIAREEWEQTDRAPLYQSYSEEPEEHSEPKPRNKPAPPPKQDKKLGGLIAAMLLEAMALILVLLWWLLWS